MIGGRVSKAGSVFTKPQQHQQEIKKIRLYNTLITLLLMYRCETWKMNNSVRQILKIKWKDKMITQEIL